MTSDQGHTSALAQLGALREAVARAGRRVQEAETEVSKSRRNVERACEPLRQFYRDLGAGRREPDAALEQRLIAEVHQAQGFISTQPTYDKEGRQLGLEALDERAAALREGAKAAREEARQALEDFAREHFAELCAERAALAEAVATQMADALAALDRADSAWRGEAGWWGRFLREANHEELLASVPENPAHGLPPRPPGPAPAPMPERLIASEPEEPTA